MTQQARDTAGVSYFTRVFETIVKPFNNGEMRQPCPSVNTAQSLKVFLSYSARDKLAVRTLAQQLRAEGVVPWFNEQSLLPGQRRRKETAKAIRTTDVVLVCLSRSSVNEPGYAQTEIRLALDVADEQPEGTIFVIPVLLEECLVPDHLSELHRVDLFEEPGYARLVAALKHRAAQLGRDLVPVPCKVDQDEAARAQPDRTNAVHPAPLPTAAASQLPSQNYQSVQLVTSGLLALVELMREQTIRRYIEVEIYRHQFQQAREQITLLQGYKDLHDYLHRLKFYCYDLIVIEMERFPGDVITHDYLLEYEMNLREIVVGLQEVLHKRPLRLPDTSWIGSLETARNELQNAVKQSDPELLKAATRRIRRVLDLHPSHINTYLNVTAQQLLALEMQQSMQRLYDQIIPLQPDPVRLGEFAAGIVALTKLRERLNMLIDDHDGWQLLDRELRQIEAGLKRDTQGLRDCWPELYDWIQKLCAQRSEVWVVALRAGVADLNQVIGGRDTRQIKLLFRRCYRHASNHFFQVDTTLKELCEQLGTFHDPLIELQRLSL